MKIISRPFKCQPRPDPVSVCRSFSNKPALSLLLLSSLVAAMLLSSLSLAAFPFASRAAHAETQTANDALPPVSDRFRFGTNMGWTNPAWTDGQLSTLIPRAGMNDNRIKLPEYYLDVYKDKMDANMPVYTATGQQNLIAFLIGPSRIHSNSPAGGGADNWQDLDNYSPKNLYEPITLPNGTINPNNYWASFVYQTVKTYKGNVKTWEIWNEPDFTNNWEATQTDWWTSPPNPKDLPGWNDTIFAYIRMLRVSYVAAKLADPTAVIATGGNGYESWLDATLRYTDNPDGGKVSSEYPLGGGAYFDEFSYHCYPQYDVQNMVTGAWLRGSDSDRALEKLLQYRTNYLAVLAKYGYAQGGKYPAKYLTVTETGFSSKQIGSDPGGMELLRNYLMKVRVMTHALGYKHVDTYMLTDEAPDSDNTNSYQHMGLYYDVSKLADPAQAQKKPATYGVETVARTLEDASYDAKASEALQLPSKVRGAAFRAANNGPQITVLWAVTSDPKNVDTSFNTETVAPVSYVLTADKPLTVRDWNWSQTGQQQTVEPNGGKVSLTLSATPLILIGATGGGLPGDPQPPVPAPPAPPAPTQPPAPAPTQSPAPPKPEPTATPAPAPPTTTPKPEPPTSKPYALKVKEVSASGADENAPASNLVDGNPDTYWLVSGGPRSAWVKFDLASAHALSEVRYFVLGTGHATRTQIQYSSDGTNWTTLASANGIDTGDTWGWHSIDTSGATGRFVRFYIDNSDQSLWNLGFYSEIEIWGN